MKTIAGVRIVLGMRLLMMLIAVFGASSASAHEVRPALLQLSQLDAHRYDIVWKQPANGEVAVHLRPRLSGGALDGDPAISSITPSFVLKLWRTDRESIDGQTLSIEGLEQTITDVLVSVSSIDGRSFETMLTPRNTTVRLDLKGHATPPTAAYLRLGVEHILTGTDHLLFVFGLLLLVGRSWALLKTITAFTVAHSVTLAASALGWLHVRAPVVESLVALSIVTLAVELVRRHRGEVGITTRFPWAIAFVFGLLHGCAFAGALADIGLPAAHIPLALFLFNVGVETGQLLFIGVSLGALWALGRGLFEAPWLRRPVHYAIGGFASYWFIERFLFAIGLSA